MNGPMPPTQNGAATEDLEFPTIMLEWGTISDTGGADIFLGVDAINRAS